MVVERRAAVEDSLFSVVVEKSRIPLPPFALQPPPQLRNPATGGEATGTTNHQPDICLTIHGLHQLNMGLRSTFHKHGTHKDHPRPLALSSNLALAHAMPLQTLRPQRPSRKQARGTQEGGSRKTRQTARLLCTAPVCSTWSLRVP